MLKSALCSRSACSCEVSPRIGEWTGEDIQPGDDDPQAALGADKVVFRSYRSGRDTVVLCLACFYDVDSADMAHAPEVCYPALGWTIRESAVVQKTLGGSPTMISRMVVEKPMKRELVYNWWITGGRIIPGNSLNRLYQVLGSVLGRPSSTVWVRISMEPGPDQDRDEERLTLFAAELVPLLSRSLSRAWSR
jgi:EpsI family protein